MTDKPAPIPVENIPSVDNGISAIASANSPFIYFEAVPFFGTIPAMGKIALACARQIASRDGKVLSDHVLVAHLVGNLNAIEALRDACNGVLAMNSKPEGPAH